MKKRQNWNALSRTSKHKWAMLRNMVTSLIKHERIVTTVAKAKELRFLADRLVTYTKREPKLANIRRAGTIVREKHVLTKLFEVLGPRYQHRNGGYTRVLKLSKLRKGDGAAMAVMEYVDRPGELRAARPPTSMQKSVMDQYLKEKLGLEPDQESLEEGMQKLNVGSTSNSEVEESADVIDGAQVEPSDEQVEPAAESSEVEKDESNDPTPDGKDK